MSTDVSSGLPPFVVVTESPASRKVLDSHFLKLGLPLDYQMLPVVQEELARGQKPTAAQVKDGTAILQGQLKNAKLILPLGAVALKAVTKKAGITEAIGKIIPLGSAQVIPCYSPAYIARDPSKEPEFRSALKRFADVFHGTFHQKTDLTFTIINRDNLEQFLRDFEACDEFVYDLETSGLDWYHPDSYVNCMGIHLDSGKTYVLPLKKAPTLPEDAQKRLVQRMASMNKKAINQNIKFDSLWMIRKYECQFYSHFDTMLAHHLLDENSPHGLKQLARYYLNAPDYDLTTSEKKGNVDAKILFKYCAWDCYYTYQLKKIFVKELMKDLALRKLFYRMIMPAARMMERVESVGHFLDLPRMASTKIELETKLRATEVKLGEIAGEPVNWNSPKQVSNILFNKLGMVPTVFTDTGAASTGEGALAELEDHPIKALLMEYRRYQKFLSTYIDGWQEYMVKNRLYLGTKLHGTVTGRWSSRLHQVSRDGTVRNLFTAPDGWTFVQADLSQAELRVAAIASRDPELIRCYAEGIDVHWRTTIGNLRLSQNAELVKMGWDTVIKHYGAAPSTIGDMFNMLENMGPDAAIAQWKGWKEQRKYSKGINFGYLYSMGAKKFTEYAKVKYQWDVELGEAEEIRQNFFSTYSALPAWHERQKALVRIDGGVRNLAGRLRRLPGIWSSDREIKAEAERQSINSPIQGFIGDLKVMGMLEVFHQTPRDEVEILGEVHDSVLMWVRNDCLDATLPKVKKLMENPSLLIELGIELPVPIVVDLEVGRWGAGSPWKGA